MSSVFPTTTTMKAKAGTKAAKSAVKNPGLTKAGAKTASPIAKFSAKATKPVAKLAKPVAKRRARNRIESISDALRSAADELVTYGPQAAQELGLVEPPKPKRTAPRVMAGVVIGASAMYFLEPEHGKEHREKVAELVG
jgi:hypothetical protein